MGLIISLMLSCDKAEDETKSTTVAGNPVQTNSTVISALSSAGISTNSGDTPPTLEGIYNTQWMRCYNASTNMSYFINQYMNTTFQLYGQSGGSIYFAEQISPNLFGDGVGGYITGAGQDFTVWMFNSLSNGAQTAFILSGSIDYGTGDLLGCISLTVYTVKGQSSYEVGDWYAALGTIKKVTNPAPTKGNVVFWTARQDIYPITVSVDGVNVGTITVYITGGGAPQCGTQGCVTIEKDSGYYNFTATDGYHNWSGTFYINAGDCSTVEMT